MVLLFFILWFFPAFIIGIFSQRAEEVEWYEYFEQHYQDSKYYKQDLILGIIPQLSILIFLGALIFGPLFIFFLLSFLGIGNKGSSFYLPKSLWMIKYNRKKVETYFKTLKEKQL